MSEKTNISWTDCTWNPWRGCTKVSPGCLHCYAEELVTTRLARVHQDAAIRSGHWAADRFSIPLWGKGAPRVRASAETFNAPLRWNKKPLVCCECGEPWSGLYSASRDVVCSACETMNNFRPRRVFFGSLMDWLDPEVPIEWLAEALDIVSRCDRLTFQLVTKRPELWAPTMDTLRRLTWPKCREWVDRWYNGEAPHNIWVITSVEDQKRADERIPELLKIPAVVRGLSVEPLLEHVDLSSGTYGHNGMGQVWDAFGKNAHCPHGEKPLDGPGVSWVIVGGESGPHRRDCGVEAIVDVVRQCRAAGVPTYVKQDCAFRPGERGRIPDDVWAL